ncbi:hypothetical protein JG688_00007149 [Phytophthora aleatoria]|uniref:USP domain-containing protein n=1 Tax=Phytophthora aleatoria TaxID=2496075 RepID=A0A8J5IPQ7_9STRA|nr:hypothetical protein JG688_00007149 [Phytophthora aleatoria]
MHYEFVAGLEVTYGNALAAGGGFHRVTTAEGAAAEVSPHTYLWYKLSSEAPTQKASPPSSSDSDSVPLAITQLCIGDEQPPSGHEDAWTKLDKSVDRHKGRFLWYQASQFQPPTSPSVQHKQLMPLKEIRVVRDLKDVPEGFESLDEPLLSADDTGTELRTYLCFRRLSSEDFTGSKWSILNQKAGNWIDVKDLSSNKWSVAQILQHSTSEIRVHIPTWKKGRDEFLSRSTCRNRVAKLGTHTNVYMSPAYPYPRKQGSMWNANMKDLQQAREQFDKYFYDREKQKTYLPRYLIPFIERSLLCTFLSSDLADEMNAFHQHVLKNVIACMLGDDAGSVMVYMLSLLRMILNGHSSCMFFYIKYPGSYTAAKYQRLVYTSYLVSPDALAAIPTRHPCRSFYFIDNVDLFVQAGGFRLILQRLAGPDIALTEVLLYCTILNEAKPCLTQQKRRRSSSSSRRRSTTEAQTEDFFREFLNATFSRLRRMSGEELKDDDGLIDHIVGVLDLLCQDGLLLGSRSAESDIDESAAADGSGSSCDVEFAEAIEIFHLDLSKKFICCPYLSQRLLGISRINDLISMAQRKDTLQRKASLSLRRTSSSVSTTSTLSASNSSDNLTSTSGEQPVTKWLRTKYIVEWLTASDILEVILGDRESCTKYSLQEGTHLEILKRSKKIFGFVAAHGLLTEKHIVLMWKTALSQLRSGRKTVFDILITLCGVLSADLMDVVVMLLTQVPLSDYDELVVNFIKRVIMIASKLVVDAETGGFKMSLTSLVSAASGSRNKLSASAQKDLEVFSKVVSLCCTLYWNAILQTEAPNESGSLGLRPSMRGEVEAALADSLNHVQKLWISYGSSSSTSGKEQQQLLSDYLRKCAENIKSGTLVETSMSLIQRIVDGYGGGSSSLAASLTRANSPPTTSSELLKELNNAHNIVSVVVEAIQNYVAQSDPKNRSQTAHLVVIKNRLAFLGYIVTKSDLKLPFEAVCQLWGCFNGPESTMEEHEVFFAWFTTVIPDPNNFVHRAYSGHTGFSEAVVGEIFQSLIRPASPDGSASQISLDMHTMSKESFWALERLFRFVNTMYTRPQVEDPDNIDDIPSDAYLMTRLLSCIATCTLEAKQGALVLLESYSGHGEIILHCLVESRFKPVRLEAANVIAALSTTRNKLQEDRVACCNYFLQLLGDYSGPVSDEEYYNVFTLLVTSADDLAKFAILPSSQILCRRIKAFEIKDDALGVPADSTPPTSRRRSIEGSRRKGPTGPAPGNQVLPPAPDALLEGQLSTLLAIIKRIPAVLADGVLDVPCDGRSLREVIAPSLHDQEGIINELFHECLFATPDKQTNGEIHSEGSEGGIVDIQASSSSQYYLRQPKCRSDSCRKVAFDLLTELSIDNTDGLRFLLTQMANQHTLERPPEPSVATSAVSTSKRKNLKTAKDQLLQRGKYVGLKNLGCTCYLNSTVQSFFMMPRFRRQVLRLQSSGNGGDKAEAKSLTYELQSLFAHLEGSAKPYYNPRPFTRAMKTWDGETVDVNVQQDASEFLTSFFQQIESEMNGISAGSGDQYTSDENILNTFFGGEFSNELVAEGDRYSERFEPFHFISVPVRDRKNLKESLDGWVEGEKVSYTWENGSGAKTEVETGEEEEKVTLETHKRISISKLPAYLIIHLKRFEFDFEKMQQIKLHDRFEFPTELDMYPYTKEGQQDKRKRSTSSADEGTTSHDVRLSTSSDSADDGRTTAPEYSQYELVGTVVHLGTAHSGHYYSFLKDQQVPSHKNQWYEFNDTLVTPFDPTQIPDECFGGEDSARARHDSASGSPSLEEGSPLLAKMKNRSSFMLFYARASPELGIVSDEDASCFSFSTAVLVAAFCSRLKRRASARLAHLRGVAQVIAPEPIRKLIAMENRLFWRKRYLYDTRCLKFTYNLLRSCLVGLENAKNMAVMPRFEPVEVQFEALQVATKFVFGTLWQGGDVSKVLEWRLILQSLYHSDVGGCRWFLSTMEANESLLLELLVFNEHREVRELMANVISEAIVTTSNTEFEEEAEEKSPSYSSDGKKQLPASFEFMFFLIQLMPALLSVPVHHHRQYFLTMYDFVQTGRNEGSFLVVNSVVGAIVSLLTGLGNTQPLLQLQLKKHKSRQILKRIDLSVTILKLLSVLIRCSLPPAMDVESDAAHPLILPANMAQEHVDLTPADHDVLLNERFITLLTQRASRYTKETKPLEQIVSHLCWESRRVTAAFLDKIMHGIEVEDHHDVKPYFRTLNSLLKIRDSLAVERLTDGLTKLVAVMASQQRYFKATETSLDMLARLAKRHSGVTQWLRDNHQSCVWMEKWLMAHRGAEGYLQQRKTVLVKPNSTSSWVNVSATSSGLIKAIDRSISKLLPRIRSILDPEAVVETFYDSDDNPQRLVGKRVRVKWAKDKWYEGTVQQFNEDTYEHFVAYDDGDKRSYHMSEKLFYVVNLTPSPKPRKKKQQQA